MLLALCLWGVSGGVVSAEWPGLVNCGKGAGTKDDPAALDCDFVEAIAMINTLINWLIMIAMPLAAVAFAYAGWLRISAGDNSSQITKSNHVFVSVGIGFMVILSGWLVFKLIADTFLNPDAGYGTYLN